MEWPTPDIGESPRRIEIISEAGTMLLVVSFMDGSDEAEKLFGDSGAQSADGR